MTAADGLPPEPKRWATTRAHGMVEARPGEPSFVDSRDYDALRARAREMGEQLAQYQRDNAEAWRLPALQPHVLQSRKTHVLQAPERIAGR